MRYLMLFITLIFISFDCHSKPKYSKGTCFENEFSGIKIIKVTSEHYEIITYIHFLLLQESKVRHKQFEERINNQDLKLTSCDQIKQE